MSIRYFGKNKNGKDKWQIDYYINGRKGRRVRKTIKGTKEERKREERRVL